MKLDLSNVPFTYRDSYMVVSYINQSFRIMGKKADKEGMYLRSVRGGSRNHPLVAKIIPLVGGKEVPYEYEASEGLISMKMAADAKIEITFADENTILVRGSGNDTGLKLTEWNEGGNADYIMPIPMFGQTYYKANIFKNDTSFYIAAQEGTISIEQNWDGIGSSSCLLQVSGEQGFQIAIEEARKEWHKRQLIFDFDESSRAMFKAVADYVGKMPEVPDYLKKSRELAAYINWESRVAKDDGLTRNALYPSKNWMIGAFSWDQCFIAQALSYHLPLEAWDQFMIMFDYQDDTGRIPDAVTDSYTVWNFCKPPVHGWTLVRMMEQMTLTREQMTEAYMRLGAWTSWWYNYRDPDHDGICEYHHGNDSGWDNSTVFKDSSMVESPDLSAELVLQTEALGILAGKLGKYEEQKYWEERSKKQLDDMLEHCFDGDRPFATDCITNKPIESRSLLPYTSIILGKRLPKEKRDYIIKALKEQFLTEHGFATEMVDSPLYQSDGYWRGPIWAPTMTMLLDGLWQCGEEELVKTVAERYVAMVDKTGFPENYDSLTGDGNRDRAFAWTASSFLVIAHRYLYESGSF